MDTIGVRHRERFASKDGQNVLGELEGLIAGLTNWSDAEHNGDGTHGDITANSATIAEEITVSGTGSHNIGPVEIADTLNTGSGTGSGPGILLADKWGWKINSDSFGEAFMLVNKAAARRVLAIYKTAAVFGMALGDYLFAPSADGVGGHHLGAPAFNSSDLEFDTVAGKKGFFRTAIYERLRTVAIGEWEPYTPTWSNVTMGASTVSGRLTRYGKTVRGKASITFGAGFSITGALRVSLPVNAATDALRIGSAEFVDAATAFYPGAAILFNTSTAELYTGASPRVVAGAAAPFVFGVGDSVHVEFAYEEA